MITAYVKPTNYCPVGCSHCYLPETVRADRGRMSVPTLISTANMLGDLAEAQGGRRSDVHILWHGGEPMSVPAQWYREAGDLLDELLPGHTESMQTSLIPYRESFGALAHDRFRSELGSSIDFTSRTIKGSAERFQDKWLQRVEWARADGVLVVPGTVPTKRDVSRAAQIVGWFADHGFDRFNVERYNQYGEALPDWPSNAEHSRFLIDLFDEVLGRYENGQPLYVRVLAAAIGGVLYDQPGDRWGGRCQSDFVVVEPDGALNTCPDKTSFEAPHAFAHQGASAFQASSARRFWIRLQAVGHRNDHCATCENNAWCRSGCPINPQSGEGGEAECAGFKVFLDHVRERCRDAQFHGMARRYLAEAFGPPAAMREAG